MTKKSLVAAALTATILSAAPLSAQTSNPDANAAVAELQAGGYSVIEVSLGAFGFEVEAIGDGRSIERRYDASGRLREEEIVENGIKTETTFDAGGNVIETETRPVEDEDLEDALEREQELLEAAQEAPRRRPRRKRPPKKKPRPPRMRRKKKLRPPKKKPRPPRRPPKKRPKPPRRPPKKKPRTTMTTMTMTRVTTTKAGFATASMQAAFVLMKSGTGLPSAPAIPPDRPGQRFSRQGDHDMKACRSIACATLALWISGGALWAQDIQSQIVAQLQAQGFERIEIARTWLGRIRIEAEGPGIEREIILNPNTGEILRDYWERDDDDNQSGLFAPSPENIPGGAEDDDDDDDDDDDATMMTTTTTTTMMTTTMGGMTTMTMTDPSLSLRRIRAGEG